MRRGGRSGNKRGRSGLEQLPWQQPVNNLAPVKVLSDDQVEAIHNMSLRVLEEIGIDFLLPRARDMLKAAGADVTEGSERVRFDRAMIEELVARAPSEFTLHARNPAHNLKIGGTTMTFCMVASTPNCSDIAGGRRSGNFEDFCDFIRLAQSLNIIHLIGGYPVEPVDLHPSIRHLDALAAQYRLCDKVGHAYSLGLDRILDGIELTRIARGISSEQMSREPSLMTIINSSSPLRIDNPMLVGIIEMSSRNQLVVMTPFTLSGAMAPATIAGALTQQNAEALAGIAFTQVVNPGAPVAYGGFTSNVDMKSGAPAFGTPENAKAALAGGQLARRYNLPYRSTNANASNAPDVQAAYESQMSIWSALMGHANILKHGAGWIEGGLCASFEKVIIDAEMLQMMAQFFRPLEITEESMGLDAMKEVGPGGHFFGAAHTMSRYETAFYNPILSDWRNFENWQDDGSQTATERAHKIYRQLLEDYVEPPMDPAIAEEMAAFVTKRKEEGGAPAD